MKTSPKGISTSDYLLSEIIYNELFEYIDDFSSIAWTGENMNDYIETFKKPEEIIITSGQKHSKDALYCLLKKGYISKTLNFSASSWTEKHVRLLFKAVAEYNNNPSLSVALYSNFKKIEDDKLKIKFINHIIRNYHEIKNIDKIIDIFTYLEFSNSEELKRISEEVADLVLSRDNPVEEFKQIEKIYLSNELPNIAKVYNVFRIFHTNPDGKLWVPLSPISSPVLLRHRAFSEVIIFSDLLKANLGSNNINLKNYLYMLKQSDEILKRINNKEIEIDTISEKEKIKLEDYIKNLAALYNQSKKGKEAKYNLKGELQEDINNLMKLLKAEENLLDRVVRMYGNFIGIKSYDDAINYMESKVKQADERGRMLEKLPFSINQGDFIKGINDIKYLPLILNNGSVSSEFLGSSATKIGDTTPLDTDGSVILKNKEIKDMFESPSEVALDYGNTWIVLKNDGKFLTTRNNDQEITNSYIADKLELFHTGVLGADHYGIRTGFASTDIDYIITREYTDIIGYEIAKNGFYIPVIDTEGKLLFTSKMYDEIRKQMEGLSHFGINKYNFSENLDFPNINQIIEEMKVSKIEADIKKENIKKAITEALKPFNLHLSETLDGNLTRNIYQLIDTGSTGRGTSNLNDADFDFILFLDQNIYKDEKQMKQIVSSIRKSLGKKELSKEDERAYKYDLRLKSVHINGIDIDIDISFEGKTDKITYSSNMAVQDKFDTMEKISSKKTELVKANIILAKKILKEANVYKPANSNPQEGGLGGIGIENWILSHGGSFKDAAETFIEAYETAIENSTFKTEKDIFIEFNKIYKIWDFGIEFFSLRKNEYKPREFINTNLNPNGLNKMASALKQYLYSLNIENNINQPIKR